MIHNFDPKQQFEAIKKSATDAVKEVFPVEGKLRTIRLDKIWVEDTLDPSDYAAQSTAKSKEATWGAPVYAALSLIEKSTGKVVDKSNKLRLFVLPKLTERTSYIVGGNEYQVTNQLRLKPGVYTIRKQNGELKTQINLSKGKNFDLVFNEKTGVFFIQKIGGGQANIPLHPILTHLGISPSTLTTRWGSKLEAANKISDPKAVARAAVAFGAKLGDLKGYFENTSISPETTKIVLGKSFDRVDGPMLLEAATNLLEVHLGKKEPTDRDSLAFKEILSVEDFLHERIHKNKQTLAFKLKRSIDNLKRTKLTQLVNPGAFGAVIENFFTQDDKATTTEQTNPLEMISGQYRTTVMGSGGITSRHAIKKETREIHPSHYGFIDPIHTPESDKIGVNLHLPLGVSKDDRTLKSIVIDHNKKPVMLDPTTAYDKYIAFPGQTGDLVKAQYQGKTVTVARSKVDYFTPNPQTLFSVSTNMVPYLASNQGNRAMMASKMLEQAIALKHREAPLVQVGSSNTSSEAKSMEQLVGKSLAVYAPEDGTVTSISEDVLVIKTDKGDKVSINLYNNFSLNRKSFMHHDVLVKKGDKVKKGQLLADSNYTKGGTLALGTNMRVAYLPYKGLNFEDGIVITDSAASKLTSEHIHKKVIEIGDNHILNITSFMSYYPNAMNPQNAKKLDRSGVIQKGEIVKQGDILIAVLQKRTASPMVAAVSRVLSDRPKDASIYWTQEDSGVVMDVQRSGAKITVFIKTEEAAKIGDKLSGRMGNKGIITSIIPDKEAPHDAKGQPVEIMLNPHGVITRINIGQIYESAAGKAALKNGAPHVTNNFTSEDYLDTTRKLLTKAGVDDKEELFDPTTKKSLGKVHVGNPYVLKLFKQGTVNFSTRQGGPGQPYDANQQPLKAGGEEAAKSMDLLTIYSLLSHGARANLREMSSIKSNQNDEFWKALKSGQQLPPPQTPFVYNKFINYLKGAGIDVKKDGSKLTLAPLTDAQVRDMSAGEIKKNFFYRGKDLEPIKGGFFDKALTGGFKGTKWNHLELHEPTLNPVFENAVRKITGLGKKLDDIMAGTLFVDKEGKFNTDGKGATGGHAIEQLLKEVDVEKDIASLLRKASKATGPALDDINKKLRYLTALKDNDLKPATAYMRKTIPVLPPVFRPVYPLPTGSMASSDVNFLYQNTGVINEMMKLPVMNLLAEDEKKEIRTDLYNHIKGVSGLTDLSIKGRVREGFISEIKGGQPKEGFFISKMLSKKQDFVGRGTIIPEPDLGIDEAALPEEMCWKIFEPFVVVELRAHGKSPLQAKEEIKRKTALAKKALDVVMRDRHILLNRAPSLHKFSIMAFKPKITEGRAIKLPPLVVKGFNADFDGDTMTVHTPITAEANEEAKKMLPSNNLFKPGTGALMIAPSQEAQIGLFYLSKTPAGIKQLAAIVGPKYPIEKILNKKGTGDLLMRLAKEMPPQEFGRVVAALKSLGEQHAFDRGFTLGLNDLKDMRIGRDAIVNEAKKAIAKNSSEANVIAVNDKASKMMDALVEKKLKDKDNPLYDMVESGARGDRTQLRSIVATPLFVTDAKSKIVATPISKSYSEGLDISDYWVSMYGARRGGLDRSIQTSLPGAFSKDIMASTIDNVISSPDCGTKDGIMLGVTDSDILERFLAGDQGGLAHNTLVTSKEVNLLSKKGLKLIKVRSPLTCHQAKGVCAKCHGLDEHGVAPGLGDNVGAKAGQTISEPLVQMIMNTRHTGGVAGTGSSVGGYARINQLLQLPKIVHGSATLAPKTGKVTRIEKGLAGGFNVWIGAEKSFVAQGLNLKVKIGSTVLAGDPLSEGVIKPQELVKYKGMQAAQEYVVNELHSSYKAQGAPLHRRVFETIVRSLGNTTRVVNNPKDTDYLPGDVMSYAVAKAHNENLKQRLPSEMAEGLPLAEEVAGLKVGKVLTREDLALLKAKSIKDVIIERGEIKHVPFLKGMSNLPLLRKDWMSGMGYRYLSKALTEGASQGWETDLSGYHPVPALAQGTTFGKGKEGKY